MGRLTRRSNDEIFLTCGFYSSYYWKQNPFYEAVDKLAHYEDMEEQGRLIELPCAVGDTVWRVCKDEIKPYYVFSEPFACFVKNLWGKEFFATEEEAERKLKELEGDK